MKISIRYKLFLSHFFAILLVSGSIGSFFYTAAINNLTESLRSRLKYSAAILSHTFLPGDLDTIRLREEGSEALRQDYIKKLQALVESNPDIAFIYAMSLADGQVRFILDSDTEEPAELGEIYEEYIPELIQGFKTLSVDKAITTDKWGSFMSGYAPIFEGEVDYMVGIDMFAEEVNKKLGDLRRQGLISLLLSVLFASACASFLSRSMLARIQALHTRCLEHSPLKEQVIRQPGDELDGLSNAFDYMLESVQATHEHLERQVKTRTKELEDTNSQLTDEVEERRRMENVLKESATTDYLTRLPNRREFLNQIKEASLSDIDYSVALLDVDNFKAVNNLLGHEGGDEVLRKFARALLHLVAKGDLAARWGGQEFAIYFPNKNLTQARIEAERLIQTIRDMSFGEGNKAIALTVSIGLATSDSMESWEHTIKNADIAVNKAKQNGRDGVATEPSET